MRDAFDWLPPFATATARTGDKGWNFLQGGEGHDILDGRGGVDGLVGDLESLGASRDILIGGGGQDYFYFQFAPAAGRDADVIMDFKPGRDHLALLFDFLPVDPKKPKYGAVFDKLDPDSFTYGKGPKDADDFVIYRKKTGALFIDEDGTGPEAMHKIVILANKAKIDASDIIL